MNKFCDIVYTRCDIAALGEKYAAENQRFIDAETYEEAKGAFERMHVLSREAETAYSIASVRNTMDTSDKFYEDEVLYYGAAFAALTPVFKAAAEALLKTPFRADFEKEFGKQLFTLTEADFKLQTPKNEQLTVRANELSNEYSKLVASCSVNFMGEECNFYGLLKHMQSLDREVRRNAFIEWAKLYEGVAEKLDEIYTELVNILVEMAKNAGFDDFFSYIYLARGHFDWSREDAARFKAQVKEIITPAVDKLMREKGKRIGVDKVRYYDEDVIYADGNPTPKGTPEQLIAAASKMYHELSAETGEFFDFMTEHELFDLLTRPSKHMGGYCTSFPIYKAPFIFSNFNGTSADIDVLTHEAGHAFEYFLSSRTQPLDEYTFGPSEINEIHSMSMELFAYPWMDLFCKDEADKYRGAHLTDCLSCIPYLVCVDEFQHRVFEDPTMDADARRRVWRELELEYMPWRDYEGSEYMQSGGFWMQKQHIFLYPFYYLEYALSQICAFQFYNKIKVDREGAWNDYLNLCRAGGSLGYLDLLKLANLRSPFEDGCLEETVKPIVDDLDKLFNK